MAPEVFNDNKYKIIIGYNYLNLFFFNNFRMSFDSDIYALGIVICEFLTG